MICNSEAIGINIGRYLPESAFNNMGGEAVPSRSNLLNQMQSKKYIIGKFFGGILEIRKTVASEDNNHICIGIVLKGFIDHDTGIVSDPFRVLITGGMFLWQKLLTMKRDCLYTLIMIQPL
jgi:hypothetical protein